MTDARYRPDLKGASRARFREANPDAIGRVGGDVPAIRQIAAIDRRVVDVKDRMRKHLTRFEESWVAREAVSLWQKRAVLAAKHPTPQGPSGSASLSADELMSEARRNVRARGTRRMSAINRIGGTMKNAVTNTLAGVRHDPALSHAFSNSQRLKRRQQP